MVDLEPEVVRWRRRSFFSMGIVLQGLLVAFTLLAPEIFRRGAEMMGITLETKPKEEYTLLIPPDLLKKLNQPPPETNNLSDKNRRAQGKSPTIDPHGLRMPYSRGNTPLPELPGGGKPQPPAPPSPPPSPAPGASASPSPAPPAPKKEDDQAARLRLEEVRPPSGSSGQRLDLGTPGDAIQQSLQAAVRGRGSGAAGGYGDSPSQLNNLNPNFSTEGPIILSDTKGVDFGPYLARVVYAVRRNWYAVIPEAARLGQKGRVAIVFEILKDGSVPQLRLVGSSGLEPLDRAALSGIRASIPFPPLPQEFTGEHLVLQFNFLYNIGYGP
ncbi:MAG TPA: TonB family protein [Candidatus Methylomirabilis sp.]|nr:TonB family protein [Candidatus Methylomirabilis sp.]